ncbi:sensor histidine kinase [Rugamonas sp. CCM 8940]|uniref:sensor histidine kinase n=1 Tax=Rugamonas sp. CCM 8940 TaxID=2765359 RepID=UPI0018F5AD13|nr:sensor histidine kinase [Rugamonas sp. CCM 8940]MBJ7310878.1 sensor histidine kinase [Rugamonas sp. CCM 8940]
MTDTAHSAVLARAIALLAACGAAAHAATPLPEQLDAPQALGELLLICATALLFVAMAMLWRHRHQAATLAALRAKLAHELHCRTIAEQALHAAHNQQWQRAALPECIKESERQRIAHDIHDDLGQNLLTLKLEVSALRQANAGQAALAPQLQRIEQHLELSIQSMRAIINELSPVGLEAGLATALRHQVDEFSRLSGIDCQLQADQAALDAVPDDKVDAMLYRILQESLSNIVRHARATQVHIALCRQARSLTMTVSDNGIGMPGAPARGLLGIQRRITQAGGQFNIASQPGQGTALSLSLPLAEVGAH